MWSPSSIPTPILNLWQILSQPISIYQTERTTKITNKTKILSKILRWLSRSTKLDILYNFNTMGLPTSGYWILDHFISDVILKIKGYTIFALKTTYRFCEHCFPLHLLYVLNILINISLTLFLLLISFISVHISHFNVLWDFLCFTKNPF